MADVPTDGEWGTIEFKVPDFMETAKEAVNSVAEVLIAVLDVALAALRLAKAFLVGYLDPIAAIVQQLLDEVKNLIRDFRQLGVYITGDWNLLSFPYEEIRGGFSEYERRMIARLTDQTDPTRPDVSADTAVFSVFFYLSVDVSDIQRLIRFIKQLIRYFNQTYNDPSGPPVPYITEVTYGLEAANTTNILQFGDLGSFFTLEDSPPNVAQAKWKVSSPVKKNPYMPFPALPPGGFIVTVSTIKDGIPLSYDRPRPSGGMEDSEAGGQAQPRETGVVRDEEGRPVVLHGGIDMLSFPDSLSYNASIEGGKVKKGRTRVFGTLPDGSIIPLDEMVYSQQHTGKYLLQRTFYVPVSASATQWAMGEFSELLKWEDMPYHAVPEVNSDGTITLVPEDQPAGVVYVRVASTTAEVSSEGLAGQEIPGSGGFVYDFGEFAAVKDAPGLAIVPQVFGYANASAFSDSRTAVFPGVYTQDYFEALKAALLVLFLARPDLVPLDELGSSLTAEMKEGLENGTMIINQVAKNRCGLEKFQHLNGLLYSDYRKKIEEREANPIEFRKNLLKQIERVAQDIYSKTGPLPEVEKIVVENTQQLRAVTWREILEDVHGDLALSSYPPIDLTLLGSLSDDRLLQGLAQNPYSIDIPSESIAELFANTEGIILDRDPDMLTARLGEDDPTFKMPLEVPKALVDQFLSSVSPALLPLYEKSIVTVSDSLTSDEDPSPEVGSIRVRPEYEHLVDEWGRIAPEQGSADLSPVYYANQDALLSWLPVTGDGTLGIMYCRGLFASYQDGVLFQEAATALGIAASAFRRSPEDGEWIALRFFDQFPAFDKYMTVLVNWIEAISRSLDSILDTIEKYIEFVEARIVELQQLIKRINALILSMLGFTFKIPQCSALALVSNGTAGVLSDLVSAANKPQDSPLSYGAGLAVVVPAGPAFAMDILRVIFDTLPGLPDPDKMMSSKDSLPNPMFSVDTIPEETPIPPTDPPDVL